MGELERDRLKMMLDDDLDVDDLMLINFTDLILPGRGAKLSIITNIYKFK
ncbi:hypothetical protein [Acinetobacter brisouii]